MGNSVFQILANKPEINGIFDVIFIIVCLLFGLLLVKHIINLYKFKEKSFYFGLYFFHLLVTFYFYYLSKNAIIHSDAAHYYLRIVSPESYYDPTIRFGIGTQFIKSIVYVLYEGFNLSYLSCFLFFSNLGFAGMVLFMKIVYQAGFRKGVKFKGIYLFPLILFLPNVHMWTVALGKDSLIYFGIMLFTYSLINLKKNIFFFLLGGFLVLMIRPHVFVLVVLALFITILIWSDLSNLLKVPILLAVSVIGYYAMNFLMNAMFNTSLSLATVIEVLDERTGYYAKNNYSGSVVDTSSYPFFFKFFSYLYRPLFEKINFNYLMVSIDNIFSLFFSLAIFSRGFLKWLGNQKLYLKFSFLFFLVAVSLFASIFSNFGIAVRQKTMFIFSLYIVALPFVKWKYEKIQKKKILRRTILPKIPN